MWAHCDSNADLQLQFHGPAFSDAALEVDLFAGPCLHSCSGRGACSKGSCVCQPGFFGVGCESSDNALSLSPELTFLWHLEPDPADPMGPPRLLVASVWLRGWQGWAAVAFVNTPDVSMSRSDFFLGSCGGGGGAAVQEAAADPADPHGHPLLLTSQRTITRSSVEFTPNGDTWYHFTRVLVPDPPLSGALPLRPRSPLWLSWAFCESNLTCDVAFHGSQHVASAPTPLDLFVGACPNRCNQQGVCVGGVCECFPNRAGADCAFDRFSVSLTPTFNFSWWVDGVAEELVGELTLSGFTGWAAIGLKATRVVTMAGCDFLVGESFSPPAAPTQHSLRTWRESGSEGSEGSGEGSASILERQRAVAVRAWELFAVVCLITLLTQLRDTIPSSSSFDQVLGVREYYADPGHAPMAFV